MGKAVEWIATVPWCITESALVAMISIAERQPVADLAERMHGPKSLALRAGAQRDDTPRVTMRDGVAVIRIDGPLYRYADYFTDVSGGVTTERLALDFQAALDDLRTEAILFVVDSPGGEATGIGELADAIYRARGQKPMAAYIEGYGASAAYWIASAAGRVTVDPSALVGSIGTVLGVANPAARPQPPRTIEVVSSQSPKKRVDVTTQAGRAYLQQLADDMTEVFIAAVQRHRGLSREQILAVEGGLLVGEHAVDAGLADDLGTEEGAIAALREQAASARRPAFTTPRASAGAVEEQRPMSTLREFWAGFWGGAQDAGVITPVAEAEPVAGPQPPTPPAADDDEVARLAEIEQRAAEAEALVTRLIEERRAAAIAAFVEEAIATGKAFPAEREALTALATKAHAAGFQAELEALITARPAHDLTAERIPARSDALPLVRPWLGDGQLPPERRRALLSQTPEGRAILAREAASA